MVATAKGATSSQVSCGTVCRLGVVGVCETQSARHGTHGFPAIAGFPDASTTPAFFPANVLLAFHAVPKFESYLTFLSLFWIFQP
jgi:hypothetical protein